MCRFRERRPLDPGNLGAPMFVVLMKHTPCKEPLMTASDSRSQKIAHPAQHYRTPEDISKDKTLSPEDKKNALNTWEQDAHQLLTASGEGMPGSEEGLKAADHHRLG